MKWLNDKQQVPIRQYKPEIDRVGSLVYGYIIVMSLMFYDIGVEMVNLIYIEDVHVDLLGNMTNSTL